MATLFGVAVALMLGGADFLGGFTSRRSPPGAVVLGTQVCGLLLALVAAAATGAPAPARDLVLGAAAGSVGLVGLGCLYRGLAVGRMSVVAPISAVGSGAIPMLWGLGRGERPAPVSLAGALVAIAAVVVVARPAAEDRGMPASRREELVLAVVAAIGFGVAISLFSDTSAHAGFWPVLTARMATVPLAGAAQLVRGRPLRTQPGDLPLVAGAGALEVGGNLSMLLAFREGLTALVAPIAALYPAATVLLARVVVRERVGARRGAGLALALVGLVMIALR